MVWLEQDIRDVGTPKWNRFTVLFFISIAVLIYLLYRHHYRIQLMYNHEVLGKDTPESYHLVNKEEYSTRVKIGQREMMKSTVVVCGMVRDVEDKLSQIISKVETLGEKFKDYRVLIVENDSHDQTRELLLKWSSQNPKVVILGCGYNVSKCELKLPRKDKYWIDDAKIQKMAYLRNIYLDEVKRNYSDYNYAVVWDLDIIGSVYLDGIANSLGYFGSKKFRVDAMCANGVRGLGGFYFDTYAHRDLGEKKPFSKVVDDTMKGWKEDYTRGEPPRRVDSCFGGFTIYRISSLIERGCQYGWENPTEGGVDCEHVVLHHNLKKVYLNPSMLYTILFNR